MERTDGEPPQQKTKERHFLLLPSSKIKQSQMVLKESRRRKQFNSVVKEFLDSVKEKSDKPATTKNVQNIQQTSDDSSWEERPLYELAEEMFSLKRLDEQCFYAIKDGSDSTSLQLLQRIIEKNEEAAFNKVADNKQQNCSLMHLCAKLNKPMCLELLHKNRVPIDGLDNLRATPLIYAVAHNAEEAAAYLIHHGANLNAKDTYNKFPMLLAMKNKNYRMAQLLVNCDVHLKGTKGNTVLHTMAEDGDLQAVEYLMSVMKASPLRRNSDEEHVLFSALPHVNVTEYICQNSKQSLNKLLSHENSFSRSILGEVCINGYLDGFLVFLRHMGSLSSKQVEELLNHRDKNGDTPLITAVKSSRYEVVEFLCRCEETEINEADLNGFTPLYHAAAVKDQEMTALLKRYNASIKNTKEMNRVRRNIFSDCLLSVRTWIILTAVTQTLICCFVIWIISFSLSRESQKKTSRKFMSEVSQKTIYFIEKLILPPRTNVQLLHSSYELGVLKDDISSKMFLLSHGKQFNSAQITFAEYGYRNYYSIDLHYLNDTPTLLWRVQNDGEEQLVSYTIDPLTGDNLQLLPSNTVQTWDSAEQPWYIDGIQSAVGTATWAAVYKTRSSSELTTSYMIPVAADVNGTARKVGMVKTNVYLSQLDRFIQDLDLLGKGHAFILESDGDVIASSDILEQKVPSFRTNILNVTSTGIRSMAKAVKQNLGGKFNSSTTKTFSLSVDSTPYLISAIPYRIDNLEWTLLVVFYDREIYRSVYVATYVTAVISVAVLLVGIIVSTISGYIVTKPLVVLMSEFQKVARMDLSDLQNRKSKFTEISAIYSAMDDMTTWLREFRAFLPESLLKAEQEQKTGTDESSSSHSSSHSTSVDGTVFTRRNRFKIGLSGKVGTVLVVGINDAHHFYSLPPKDIVEAYSKLFSQVSTIVNQSKGSMQVLPQSLGMWIYWDSGDHENRAVQAALDIIQYSKQLSQQLVKEDYPPLNLSCGIHTDSVLSGNIGIANTRLFSLVGTLLKHAEQLQQYCHSMDLKVVVSETTWNKCKSRFSGRTVDIFQIDKEKMSIYEIKERCDEWANELDKPSNELCIYSNAVDQVSSNPSESGEVFRTYLQKHPSDKPTQAWVSLMDRIEQEQELFADSAINYHCCPSVVYLKRMYGREIILPRLQ